MYVGRKMTTELITVTPDTPIVKARDLLRDHNIKQVPVVDDKGNLVGILTDRDIKMAWASPATTLSIYELTYVLQKLTVESIMVKEVITITPDATIERAAKILHDKKIGSLPVMEDNKLVGIITSTDLMEVLLDALGIEEESGRLVVLVRDRVGVLADVCGLLKEHNISICSMVTVPLRQHPGIYQLVIRVSSAARDRTVQHLVAAGYKVLTEYKKDLTPYLPNS
ncbi:MAG: CBS domain-containing protein [Deltaproteobacteria bacterium]|nr:CBS domain-containing protein [Deltaproteobacteria bacterium]MBW2070611.1 CBS domain-containing protein [Deltaproteobacteria bacterium]